MHNFNVLESIFRSKEIIFILLVVWLNLLCNVAYADSNLDLAKIIKRTESNYSIPQGLLSAIAEVESNFKPYALNIDGSPFIAQSCDEAIKTITKALTAGITNIDIGVAQINYRWHKEYFSNIEEMLNPKNNLEYAGKLLAGLYKKHGSWNKAVRYYHSANRNHQRRYSQKILVSWLNS